MIYGPKTESVQAIIDRIASLTEDEVARLIDADSALVGAALDAAWDAAWDAAESAARSAAVDATRFLALDAVLATVTYDLATINGPYTIFQRDLLMAAWVKMCGMPKGLTTLDGEG